MLHYITIMIINIIIFTYPFCKGSSRSMTNPWYYFRSGYRRIKRFIAWFPIIWHDEDWDYAYLFKIMQFKISRIRKEVEKNQRHLNWEKDVRDMKVAEELLSRIGFSDFYYKLHEQLKDRERVGKCSCPEKTWGSIADSCDIETKEIRFYRHVDLSCTYCKNMKSIWMKREIAKEKFDFDFLFKHLKKRVQRWWD